MQQELSLLKTYAHFSRNKEFEQYNNTLYNITKFPLKNIYNQSKFFRLVLNFSFRTIDFNKKKALPFFLAMELLANQKCVATLSSKNVLQWKLRKGSLVGCKVTLRQTNLNEFFDNLSLALPRMEKFTPLKIASSKRHTGNFITARINEIVLFYPIELGLGINTEVKYIDVNFIFNTLSLEEKKYLFNFYKIPTKD